MKDDKKFVKAITPRDVDFAQWYTDIVKQAEMCDYSSVQGFMNLLPNGFGIWELIQQRLDGYFKETGHVNVSLPLLIPESLLNKEKDHVEGFAPEVAWVTHGGSEKLQERLCVRPTSETLFCDLYARTVQSWRDLPKLYNQWCSVVRWEKTTRPFLRTREFLWQEGHTVHETAEEAREETIRMLNVYAKMLTHDMAIPVIKGRKTEKEKFAGAFETYSVESMMYDGKALQSGTSHYFGDGFAKAFDVTYTDRNNEIKHVHQTSWGFSTRTIGALIMVHGDDDGLVVPPAVAPVQVVVVPVAAHKEGVSEKAREVYDRLKSRVRTIIDETDKSPGWKFALHEMRGVCLRLELGPKDIENGSCVIVRRDNRQKYFVPLGEIEEKIPQILEEMRAGMLQKATDLLNSKIYTAGSLDEMNRVMAETPGFVKAMWCGERACEEAVKDKTGGVTSRVIPFEQEQLSDKCFCCGKKAEHMVLWAKAY